MVFKIITTVVIGLVLGTITVVASMSEKKSSIGWLFLIVPYIMALICMWR